MSTRRGTRSNRGQGRNPQASTSKLDAQGTTGNGSGTATIERTDVIAVPVQAGILPNALPNGTQPGLVTKTVVESKASLPLQYISSIGPRIPLQFGSPYGFSQGAGIHVLPLAIDELEQDLGPRIYHKMLFDPVVKSGDATVRDGILDKPIKVLTCYTGTKEDDQSVPVRRRKMAQEIADFVQADFDQMPRGFNVVMRELLEGIALGYKLAEQVYERKEIVQGKGKQTVHSGIHPKPHEAASIVCDQYNTVLGYIPRLHGYGTTGSYAFGDLGVRTQDDSGTQVVDIPDLIPPEKMARFTWNMVNDDPRGTSHLQAAYFFWRFKIGLVQAYEAYLARFGQPSVKHELQGADLPPMQDASGHLIKDPALVANAILNGLMNYQSGGAILVPVGTVSLMEASGTGEAFKTAFDVADDQITMAILYQSLTSKGQEYGTQALGTVQQDTQGLLFSYGKALFAAFVQDQIIKPLVFYNYGEAGLSLLPTISIGEIEQQDFSTTATGIASLKNVSMIFPLHYNDVYQMLHLETLPAEVVALLNDIWLEGLKQQLEQLRQPQQQLGPDGQPVQGQPGQDPNAAPQPGVDPNAPGGPQQAQAGSGGPQQQGVDPNAQSYW